MKRSRLKNKLLNTKSDTDRKVFNKQINYVVSLQHILLKKNYDYCNSWNLIKIKIIVIISENRQGKTKMRQVKTLAT